MAMLQRTNITTDHHINHINVSLFKRSHKEHQTAGAKSKKIYLKALNKLTPHRMPENSKTFTT